MATAVVLPPTVNAGLRREIDGSDNLHSVLSHQSTRVFPRDFDKNEKIVVSPYNEEPHLLDLRTLDIPNQLLAKALMDLECLRGDYATAPYTQIFNVSKFKR